jgi:hypothetical protein
VSVHRGRGQKLFQETEAPLWERYADHDGIRFAVNLEHPLIAGLSGRLASEESSTLRLLLNAIGAALPVEMIYSDYSTAPRDVRQAGPEAAECIDALQRLRHALFGEQGGTSEQFLRIVRSTRLFEGQQQVVEKFIEEAF